MGTQEHGVAVSISRPPRQPLTDRLASIAAGGKIHYDAGPLRVRGFGLRVGSSGNKAWLLNYTTAGGRERRMTIVTFPPGRQPRPASGRASCGVSSTPGAIRSRRSASSGPLPT